MRLSCDVSFYCCGEVCLLKGVDPGGNIFRGVCGVDRALGLEEDCAVVIFFVHKVYCYSRQFFPGLHNRLVHIHAVHPFSAEFGEEGRVDVYNPPLVHFCELLWDLEEVSGKYQVVY